MEFLDPKKQKAHLVRLFIGYFLVAIALLLTTVILLYRAYGFGFKNGEVIQNGLIFISSTPSPADIYVNGQKRTEKTNVRLLMPAGQYAFELRRDGYRPWKRAINIEGGAVARFDYPFLIPTNLTTNTIKKYDVKPNLVTQSLDRRWLVVQGSPNFTNFDIYDLNKNTKEPIAFTLPASISKLVGAHSWKLVEWSSDNRHLLLQHIVNNGGKISSEYILLDRENSGQTINLTETLGVNPSKLELRDKKYDRYFIYTEADKRLQTATLGEPSPKLFIDNVLAYKTHGDDTVLYATDQAASGGKAVIKLRDGDKTYPIRQVADGSKYLLDLARYSNQWYVVAGAASENRTYVYKEPIASLQDKPQQALVPVQVLKVINPSYISFSNNARFVMVESGQQFSVYDAETDRGYSYALATAVESADGHASWIDGHRMAVVSGGFAYVFDFDKTNQEQLTAADAAYSPILDRDAKALYTITGVTGKDANGKDAPQFMLMSTPLRTPPDL